MKKKQIILNKEEITNKINRIAFSIIEDYHTEKSITLIGFDNNGYIIAEKIKQIVGFKGKLSFNKKMIINSNGMKI